jgi:hypothetical protein
MSRVVALLREIAGLFFDDGSLAIVVLAVLAATALLARITALGGGVAIAFLVGGLIAALLENVFRTARAARLDAGAPHARSARRLDS